MTQGTLYTISAPSGAGKTTLLKTLIKKTDHLKVSVSHTTRQPRSGEKNGVHYHFVTEDEFLHLLKTNVFLEHAQVFDHHYGTSRAGLIEQLKAGIDVILEIDWQGVQQIRQLMPETISIFILPPSRKALEKRLRKRAKDSKAVIAQRLHGAALEISHYAEFDYLVVNDNFSQAVKELQFIIYSQRLRQIRQASKLKDLLTELRETKD